MTPTQTRFAVFVVLLIAVVCMAVLFAAGNFRFGSTGSSAFVIYVLLGLLSAALTFGVLKSSGTVEAKAPGYSVSIAGPVVAMLLVTGGGMSYEKWFHSPERFDMRLLFEDSGRSPVAVTGELQLLFGKERITENVTDDSNVLIQGISVAMRGSPFRVALFRSEHVVDMSETEATFDEGPIVIRVKKENQDRNGGQPPPTRPMGRTVQLNVDGQKGVTASQACVSVGTRVSVTADGWITAGAFVGAVSPSGLRNEFLTPYSIRPEFPHAALMCRIAGETEWSFCGSHYDLVAKYSGCLEFDVNDIKKYDNQGSYKVTIEYLDE